MKISTIKKMWDNVVIFGKLRKEINHNPYADIQTTTTTMGGSIDIPELDDLAFGRNKSKPKRKTTRRKK